METNKKPLYISLLQWLLLLIVIHVLFSIILFNFTFNQILSDMLDMDQDTSAAIFLSVYGLVLLTASLSYYSYSGTATVSFNDELKAAMKLRDFSLLRWFFRRFGVINLCRMAVFLVFLLPYTVFFASVPHPLDLPFPLVAFYRLEAGLFALSGSWWLGLLLSVGALGAILFLSQLAISALRCRFIRRNAPSGFYGTDG